MHTVYSCYWQNKQIFCQDLGGCIIQLLLQMRLKGSDYVALRARHDEYFQYVDDIQNELR